MITMFTAPKPFAGHIGLIQENSLRSWRALDPEIQIIVIGDEQGIAECAVSLGLDHEPDFDRNPQGTPRLDSIFQIAEDRAKFDLLLYANADILFLDDLLSSIKIVEEQMSQFLVVGQRWDLQVDSAIDFSGNWSDRLRDTIAAAGRRHKPAGSDYFGFRRRTFGKLPPFALGRAGWDNWMIFAGRKMKMAVIDASMDITVIHQDHDYAHLPEGRPHYRLPESADNVTAGGGAAYMFTLRDAEWRLQGGMLERKSGAELGRTRWLETSILARFGGPVFGRWVWRFFHPLRFVSSSGKAGMYRLARRVKRLLRGGTSLDVSG